MKLVTFTHMRETRIGVASGEYVYAIGSIPGYPREMTELLAAGHALLGDLASRIERHCERIALADIRLEAPLLRPPKFLAIGLNYADHITEKGGSRPAFPTVFNKQSTCVNGPYDPIHKPGVSEQMDYEGELGFVIRRRCRHVPAARAPEVIGGYLIVNDVSVRDWQARSPTLTLGKSFDTHGPIGPWIVTPDEIENPHALDVRTYVNGEPRQAFNTRDMIWNCYRLVELLSTVFTLEPGDVVSTGTGRGVGMRRDPPSFLQPGDVVRIEIEAIGAIENRVIEEPETSAEFP